MIQNTQDLKLKFAQLIYNWVCNKFGEERDIILKEIQEYGERQIELVKTKLSENKYLSYKDVQDKFDDFITSYTMVGMYWWRFCGFYNDWNDVIDTNKVREYLWNRTNWYNVAENWNSWVSNKYAKILTRGNEETFAFAKENIDSLYKVNGLGDIMSTYSSKLLDIMLNFSLLDVEQAFRELRQESEITFSDWCGWNFDIPKFTKGYCFNDRSNSFDMIFSRFPIKSLINQDFSLRFNTNDYCNIMDDIIIIISHANIVYTFDKNEQNFIYIEELRNESKYLDTLKRRHWNKNIINKKYLILPKNKFSNDNVKSVLFFLQTLLNLKKQEFKEFSINFRLIFENLENYNDNLERFIKAQAYNYLEAFSEINNGRKISHWMWYVFPAISGRYGSEMSKKYAIQNLGEAEAYLKHEILGKRLIELCEILIQTEGKTANQIFGDPDDIKLKACMTLFGMLENTNPIFGTVLEKYFEGTKDNKTEQILQS